MQDWQLAVAIAVAILTFLALCLGIWKFIDGKIQDTRREAKEAITEEIQSRKEEDQRLHDRVSESNKHTPTHADIQRLEGYLQQITSRMDQVFHMFTAYNKRDDK